VSHAAQSGTLQSTALSYDSKKEKKRDIFTCTFGPGLDSLVSTEKRKKIWRFEAHILDKTTLHEFYKLSLLLLLLPASTDARLLAGGGEEEESLLLSSVATFCGDDGRTGEKFRSASSRSVS
jgi:hypothetical protein